ncbi:hypothetical protein ACFL6X_03610 [Candidatus Latescibacterota bacterium]
MMPRVVAMLLALVAVLALAQTETGTRAGETPMIAEALDQFWDSRETAFGGALRHGMDRVASLLEPEAGKLGLRQERSDHALRWLGREGEVEALFVYVPDPRELEAVAAAYTQTRATECPLTYIFIHQWTDGEGNWDIFTITPKRRMAHHNRFWGSDQVPKRDPELRHEIYELFSVRTAFPSPGRAGWSRLLAGPRTQAVAQLAALAGDYRVAQRAEGDVLVWRGTEGSVEAMFRLLPDPGDLDACIQVYGRSRSRPAR